MLSPSLLALVAAGADPTPDTRALAVFHRIGVFIDDDTPLAHVRTLPPGGRLIWHGGRLKITGGAAIPRAQCISREGAVEGMIALFRQAMQHILAAHDGPLTLPLSGGRDSRGAFVYSARRSILQIGLLFAGFIAFGLIRGLAAQGVALLIVYPVLIRLARRHGAWDMLHDAVFYTLALGVSALALWLHWADIVALAAL